MEQFTVLMLDEGTPVKVGDVIDSKTEAGKVKVVDKWRGQMGNVPAALLEQMEAPLFRTYTGARIGLDALSGRKCWPANNVQVLVLQRVVDSGLVIAPASALEKLK